jgi:Tfp pilus assembly protein PilX
MNMKPTMNGYRKRQTGVALIIGLVMLLLLTIIMLSAMRVTSLEERMAGNLRNQNIALQAAESALREAETRIGFFGLACDEADAANCATVMANFLAQDDDADPDTIDWDGDGSEDDINPFYWLDRDGSFLNARQVLDGPEDSACDFGLCDPVPLSRDELAALVDVDDAMIEASTNIATVSSEPRYIIQLLNQTISPDNSRLYATFLITAVAWGGDDRRSLVELQSTYRLHSRHKVD